MVVGAFYSLLRTRKPSEKERYRAEFDLLQGGFVPEFGEKEGGTRPVCAPLLTEMPRSC